MNHKVANLKLLYLLESQRHFTATGLVALKIVFMETVEYLVIGKETYFQIIIDKTLMQSFFNRGKTDCTMFALCLGTLREYILQTFVLLGTIGKNIELIALLKISIERLEQQLEILMEKRLNRDIKSNNATIGHRGTVSKLDATEVLGLRHKLRACDKRHTFLETCIDSIANIQVIFGCNNCILWQQREERLLCSIGSLELGHNLYPISDIKRELVLNLEGTDRIDIVAKEINTIRILATI